MPFLTLTEIELRDIAKRHIESLEFWLRRVANEGLILAGGATYWEAEPPVIKKEIREKITARIAQANAQTPGRFPRWIDATLIEHQIAILCNNSHYQNHFKPYFQQLFPGNFAQGREYLNFILDKCSVVRNAVYHSNPVSVRQVEQTVCYTNDIIDSIKHYYTTRNMQNDFNAPSILSYSDSLGRKLYAEQMTPIGGTKIPTGDRPRLRCGDRIKMMIEIDSSYSAGDYTIRWWASPGLSVEGAEVIIDLTEAFVGSNIDIMVTVTSNKPWHRYSSFDDQMIIPITVLPPLE
jgi:hypothetical protein